MPLWKRLLGAAAILLLLVVIAVLGHGLFSGERRGPAGTTESGSASAGTEYRTVTLYFADPEGPGLAAERREITVAGDRTSLVAATLEALVDGPLTRLQPTLPRGARILNLFVDPQGTVFVDFSGAFRDGLRGASLTRESLALGSLARTLRANFSGLKSLELLVEGDPVRTLGGNFDLSRPLSLTEWD